MIFARQKVKTLLQERRALPTGRQEFEDWSERIIQGAMLTATPESQKFALAREILDLPRTAAFETDLYFINVLRKSAANQVADAMAREIRDAVKARLAAEEKAKKQGEVTPPAVVDGEAVQGT